MFHIGQKVVCVDASLPANSWHRANPLSLKQVYVVHHCFVQCIDIDGSRRGWQNWRFRPIAERKTDISIFKKMLEPNTHVIAGEDAWDRRITPAMQVSWLDRQEAKMRLELSRMWKSRD